MKTKEKNTRCIPSTLSTSWHCWNLVLCASNFLIEHGCFYYIRLRQPNEIVENWCWWLLMLMMMLMIRLIIVDNSCMMIVVADVDDNSWWLMILVDDDCWSLMLKMMDHDDTGCQKLDPHFTRFILTNSNPHITGDCTYIYIYNHLPKTPPSFSIAPFLNLPTPPTKAETDLKTIGWTRR